MIQEPPQPATGLPLEPSPVISVRHLSKSYGAQIILSDVSFAIAESEILVILGPSGSGKTTLLRIIAGLDQQDGGTIYLKGRPAGSLPPQQRNLGVVFQEQALFQRMTVEQNIAFGLRLRQFSHRETSKIIGEMLDLTGLSAHRHKIPAQLSGGQRQRVALARALAYQPGALLFDEPFSALDAVTRVELRREVRALLRERGVPALFITHDQEEALELADNVAVLNAGKIEQIGTPFEVYNHPGSEFVATFLGAANVLLARWRAGRVLLGPLQLKPPRSVPLLAEGQPVKIVFRPEDVMLTFQLQFLDTPYHLSGGVVEDVSYTGPVERLVVRLTLNRTARPGTGEFAPPRPTLQLVDEFYAEGFPVTVTRTKWEASDMELSPGDTVAVGLKDYRVLPHYPLRAESGAKVAGP